MGLQINAYLKWFNAYLKSIIQISAYLNLQLDAIAAKENKAREKAAKSNKNKHKMNKLPWLDEPLPSAKLMNKMYMRLLSSAIHGCTLGI